MAKIVPSYTGTLRSHSLMLPACISECSGIRIFGRRIKSLAFSTDVAIIKNINADAIIATGGPTEESILRTIRAGANAVTYTPPDRKHLKRSGPQPADRSFSNTGKKHAGHQALVP